MPRFTARERRERYQREYTFQKKTGKSFFPYAVFHDTIVSLIVVGLIIGMSVLWYAQFDPAPTGAEAAFAERGGGILGPAYEGRADPGVEAYDPKPEWYFFFLFELLRIFKSPELLLVGSFLIPTIWMTLLIGWPFIDRNPDRRLSRRPIAMALGVSVPIVLLALTFYGSKAPGAGGEVSANPGAAAFAGGSCSTCHTFADAGTAGNVGPSLTENPVNYESALNLITNGQGGMPGFSGTYTEDEISCLAGYVATYSGAAAGEQGPEAATAAETYPASCEAAGGIFAGGEGAAALGE
jgi:menaquinol-cytochrome c reductase cytochrome b/c subunit